MSKAASDSQAVIIDRANTRPLSPFVLAVSATHRHGFVTIRTLGTRRRRRAVITSGSGGRGKRRAAPGSDGPGTKMKALDERAGGEEVEVMRRASSSSSKLG
jgi:hypothetical protein